MKVTVTTNNGNSIEIELEEKQSRNDNGDEVFYSGDDGENSVSAALNRNEGYTLEENVSKSVGITTSETEIANQINEQLHPEKIAFYKNATNTQLLCIIKQLQDLLNQGNLIPQNEQMIRAKMREAKIDFIINLP